MGFTRRDLLKITGGAATGVALSPMPWGFVRDTALWSENWPGIPRPGGGEVQTRYTTCTLCPAGCGVRARCIAGRPVSLAGVAGHPSGYGALCPIGLVGHHLTFCEPRAGQVLRNGQPGGIADAVEAVVEAIGRRSSEAVAILDPRPGRAASSVYQRVAGQFRNGIYCTPRDAQPYGPYGIDLENTRAIVSFGVPVVDGWLSPGRVLANRQHFRLIQVETAYSRTASMADLWVPVKPGGEAEFARALTRAVRGETSELWAGSAARILHENQPAIAVGPGTSVAELNAALGSIGKPGGFLRRRDFAGALNFESVADCTIGVLLIEEAACGGPLPWEVIQPKLAPNALVVALTPWLDGYARHTDFVIPVPGYLEGLDEAPTPAGSTVAAFSLSSPFWNAPPAAIAPADFVLRLGRSAGLDLTTAPSQSRLRINASEPRALANGTTGRHEHPVSYEDVLQRRAAEIRKEGRGSLFNYADRKSTRVSQFASGDDLWKALLAGAVWLDDPLAQKAADLLPVAAGATAVSENPVDYPLSLVGTAGPPAHASPLMSKLYRESGLRRPANAAILHPATARAQGIENGGSATIITPSGTFGVQVVCDQAVMPDTIEAAGLGPAPARIRRA